MRALIIAAALAFAGCQRVSAGGAADSGALAQSPVLQAADAGAANGPQCGGIANLKCPDGMTCQLDAACTKAGGADCGGTCVAK